MQTVTSRDGTRIAYDTVGSGPAVIIVHGALCSRLSGPGPKLSQELAANFTVINYDRRSRGDSADGQSPAPNCEVEDLAALIGEAGGSAYVYGHSSGAAVALETALALGDKIEKLALYEAPYNSEEAARTAWKAYTKQLTELLAAGRPDDAVALYMKFVGTPLEEVEKTRHSPMWPTLVALGKGLAYDAAAVGEEAAVPVERAAAITMPTLVMNGDASYPFMHITALALSKAIPNAQHKALPGQTHQVSASVLAPVLVKFFSE